MALNKSVNSFGYNYPSISHPVAAGKFDFTILFEDSFLSIVPSVTLLSVLPARLFYLRKQRRKVLKSSLQSSKVVFLLVFAALQTCLLVLHITSSSLPSRATIAASCLTLLDALGLCILSHAEHIRSVRPSAIINSYLAVTLLFDIARARTLWVGEATKAAGAVFTSALGVKVMILVAEAVEKRHILLERYQYWSPEATSGIYSRSLFWWLNELMATGFHRVIQNKDLYPIDEEMSSMFLQERGQRAWTNTIKSRRRALFWSTVRANRAAFLYGLLPRFCFIGFRYARPFLLSRTVDFANKPHEPDSIGWGLTGAFAITFIGLAIAQGAYQHLTYRFVTKVRGTLVGMIYAKTVDLSITALDESVAVTLMSSDTETICVGFATIHEIWAVPIELGIALFLLERQLGLAFLALAVVAFTSMAGILIMSRYVGTAQKVWMESIQTRIDATAAMLASMKGVKMLGFSTKLGSIIQGLRDRELLHSTRFRRLLCVRIFLGNSTLMIAPWVTFIAFVVASKYSGRTLDAAAAYTGLSLMSLLSIPMNILIQAIPNLNAGMASFDRIQSFLNSDALIDHRLPLHRPVITDQDRDSVNISRGIPLQELSSRSHNAPSSLIVLQNASFGWTSDGEPTVRDVSFVVMQHQFCFVVGPVGSGKSTLLKGLLGETPTSQGFVYSDKPTTAFVDQTPWIQNATLQQNILGVSNFEEPWYKKVVWACALEQDIEDMPRGHLTMVGSNGISLSGGQKQRLALARAVYARKELVVLDDVFSGLDADTEEQVFDRLLSKQGLFRQMRTTIILATHAMRRLSYSDHVLVLDRLGHIAEQASFEDLIFPDDYVGTPTSKRRREREDSQSGVDKHIRLPKKSGSLFASGNEDYNTEAEELTRQTGDFQVYKYFVSAIGWRESLIFVLTLSLGGVAGKMTEFILTYWTDAVATRGNEVNDYYLGMYSWLAVLRAAGLMGGFCHFFLRIVRKMASILHEKLLDTVMAAPLSFFTSTDIGMTTNRFSQDMTVLDAELPFALSDLLWSIVSVIMAAVLMCVSARYFAATMPAVILGVWILQKYYLRTSRQVRLLDLEAKSPLYSHFLESLNGLVTIRAFGWAEDFQEINLKLLDASQKPFYLLFCIQRWLTLVLDTMVAILAVILMALVVKLRDDVSPGYVGLALLNVMSFNSQLTYLIWNWTSLETSMGAIARLKSFSERTADENLPGESQQASESWPPYGSIEFKNVSASYTPSGDLVIRDINLSIKPGEKVGICGRSGSGKSSLITTLFRMLEVTPESSITIDGIDITTLPRQTVRSRLNAIPQEPFFMKGTIRFNADPDGKHTDFAIITAISKVHLWDLIFAKGGLDADLDSEFFSHGQRQLFCLARAILRKSKVVVLDEVTSSVDVKSDELMQRAIREEFADCTVVAVAHRLDTIVDFDRIVVLGEGRIREVGVPEELLRKDGGAFRELYET